MILRQPLKSAKLSIRVRNSYALAVWLSGTPILGFRQSEQKANYFSIIAHLGSKHLTRFPGVAKARVSIESIIEAQFSKSVSYLIHLLRRQSSLGSALNLYSKSQVASHSQLRQDFGVKVHPFLGRDFAGPV